MPPKKKRRKRKEDTEGSMAKSSARFNSPTLSEDRACGVVLCPVGVLMAPLPVVEPVLIVFYIRFDSV